MLFSNIFFAVCKFGLFESSLVPCNSSLAKYRLQFLRDLENGAKVFFAVSYISVHLETNVNISLLRNQIEERDFKPFMPLVLVQNQKFGEFSFVSHDLRLIATVFENVNLFNFKLSNTRNLYIFRHEMESANVTEVLLFHSCRAEMTEDNSIEIDEALLMIADGNGLIDESVIHQLLSQNIRQPIFYNFPEFQDEDFCICKHLDFYMRECKSNLMVYVWLVTVIVVMAIGNLCRIILKNY